MGIGDRRVDDVHVVLKQWAFVAYDQAVRLGDDLDELMDSWHAYQDWRDSMPADRPWAVAMSPEGRRYVSATYRVQGSAFFLLSAASHVVRALDTDEDYQGLELPQGLHAQVKEVRNVLEHWDEWTLDRKRHGGVSSSKRYRDAHPDVWPFGIAWSQDDFLVGGTIPLQVLHDEMLALWRWLCSPSPTRKIPPITEPIYPCPLVRV